MVIHVKLITYSVADSRKSPSKPSISQSLSLCAQIKYSMTLNCTAIETESQGMQETLAIKRAISNANLHNLFINSIYTSGDTECLHVCAIKHHQKPSA